MGGRPRFGKVRSAEVSGMAAGECKGECEFEGREDDAMVLEGVLDLCIRIYHFVCCVTCVGNTAALGR